jgi:hypothetical protein
MQILPDVLQNSAFPLVAALAPLLLLMMLFWLVWVRVGGGGGRQRPREAVRVGGERDLLPFR